MDWILAAIVGGLVTLLLRWAWYARSERRRRAAELRQANAPVDEPGGEPARSGETVSPDPS